MLFSYIINNNKKNIISFVYSYEAYVEGRQKDLLRAQGRVDQLADIDVISALDLLAEQGQWDRCLESASPHGPQVLHKYVALYTSQLIKVCIISTSNCSIFLTCQSIVLGC